MQMTEAEIKTAVMQAKNQLAQIEICAQLNDVQVADIRRILKNQGVDLRTLKGSQDNRRGNGKKKEEEASDSDAPSVSSGSFALIQNRVRALLSEKRRIEDELAEILTQMNRIEDEIAGRGSDDN